MPLNDENNVLFLHIPKTGGTTIRKLFHLNGFVDENPNIIPTPQHLTCDLLRISLGVKKYESYYKFTFVRNPWGRLLSDFFWRKSRPKIKSIDIFDEYIDLAKSKVDCGSYYDEPFDDHFIPQIEYTKDVDDIFRFESLEEGVLSIADRLAIEVAQVSKKVRKPHDNYWEFYNSYTNGVVADVYAEEIEKFGYEFGGEAQ